MQREVAFPPANAFLMAFLHTAEEKIKKTKKKKRRVKETGTAADMAAESWG